MTAKAGDPRMSVISKRNITLTTSNIRENINNNIPRGIPIFTSTTKHRLAAARLNPRDAVWKLLLRWQNETKRWQRTKEHENSATEIWKKHFLFYQTYM